jgi:hypothetical protein
MLPTDDAIFSILGNKYQTIFDSLNTLHNLQYDQQTVNIIVQYFIVHNNTDRLGAA